MRSSISRYVSSLTIEQKIIYSLSGLLLVTGVVFCIFTISKEWYKPLPEGYSKLYVDYTYQPISKNEGSAEIFFGDSIYDHERVFYDPTSITVESGWGYAYKITGSQIKTIEGSKKIKASDTHVVSELLLWVLAPIWGLVACAFVLFGMWAFSMMAMP